MIIIKFPARKEAINGEAKRDIKMKIITQAQHVRKLRHCQDGAKLLTLSVSQFAKVLRWSKYALGKKENRIVNYTFCNDITVHRSKTTFGQSARGIYQD